MAFTDQVVLYLAPAEADALTTSIADEVFSVVNECGNRANHISGSVTTAMEAMGRDLFDRALKKFYKRCS